MSERLLLVQNQTVQTSEFSGHTAVIAKYATWTLELNFAKMKLDDAGLLNGWLDSLQGSLGTFTYTPRRNVYPISGSKTLTSTGFALSTTVQISGWSSGAVTGLRIGQYFSLGTQLNRITMAPTNADGSGRAVIEFANPLRSDRSTGTTVNFNAPTGLFRRISDGGVATGYQTDPDRFAEFATMTAMEAF